MKFYRNFIEGKKIFSNICSRKHSSRFTMKENPKEASILMSENIDDNGEVKQENRGRGNSSKGAFVQMVNGAGLPLILEAAICFSSKLRR